MKYTTAVFVALALSSQAEARSLTIPFILGENIEEPSVDPSVERIRWAYFTFSVSAHFHSEFYGLGLPEVVEEFWTSEYLDVAAIVGPISFPVAGAGDTLFGGFTSHTHGDPSVLFITDYDVLDVDVFADGSYDNNLANPLYGPSKSLPTSTNFDPKSSFWSNVKFQNSAFTIVTKPVPEPSSWAMIIGGFGAIGSAMRARRRVSVSFG
jgi:hypothetical protein